MDKRTRQYIGLATAVISYYIVHEGAHFLYAIGIGVFKQIRFMGVGMQIDVYEQRMSQLQMGLFCAAGAFATLLCAWVLVFLCRRICKCESKIGKAMGYYVTIIMLFLDPVYLSVLCGLFGGGDMNGIKLLLPEVVVRIFFGVIFAVHLLVFMTYILPNYKMAFQEKNNRL